MMALQKQKRILWAVSSVGKGHIMRDMTIVKQLHALADVRVDWLAPDPGREFMGSRGYHVLDNSTQLLGSGKVYTQVFSSNVDEFNLIPYILADTQLHKHDFSVSAKVWKQTTYDVIVGDEAFWLLSGFASHWESKPAPFIFITDFIGTKAMQPRIRDMLVAWYNNLKFTMSHWGPDRYLYIGSAQEIPDERLGFALPRCRVWAEKHCEFVKPIVNFDVKALPDKQTLRKQLGLPQEIHLFLATVGPQGDFAHRIKKIEAIFKVLRIDFPKAHFILVCPNKGTQPWIQYELYLEGLYQYFAAADFVITQSGYGKIIELSAVGTPFIAIPLDYHFEQEYVMRHRLKKYGTGQLVTLRDHTPQQIAALVQQLLDKKVTRIEVDDGRDVARNILETTL
jgi:hypothetical protein